MNVKLLQFPDNDDPDSYGRKVSTEEFHRFLKENAQDFLHYKAGRLMARAGGDPIRKSEGIRDIVENIAVIPDGITRSVYIRTCSEILEIGEAVLQQEVNRSRRSTAEKKHRKHEDEQPAPVAEASPLIGEVPAEEKEETQFKFDSEEKELLRIMILYGNVLVDTEAEDDNNVTHTMQITLTEFILFELWRDNITFENPIHQVVYEEYTHEYSNERIPDLHSLMRSPNPVVNTFLVHHVISPHELSDWRKFGVEVPTEVASIKRAAQHLLFSLKEKILHGFIEERQSQLKAADTDHDAVLKDIIELNELKKRVNRLLGRVVVK
jgi:DNA primase